MNKLFEIHDMKCSYDRKYVEGVSKIVLEIKDLVLPAGKTIFIVGESGIGKSTILEVLGMMNNTIIPDKATSFLFFDNGKEVNILDLWRDNRDSVMSQFRKKHFNFIFQSTNLMRNFTAYENITITRMLQGYSKYSCFKKAAKVLGDLGMNHVDESRLPQELSGGQQQRLSFARAILPDFTVLFGDEPTGNLDGENAVKVMRILTDKLAELENSSAIIVSHDMHIATSFADVIVKIHKKERPGIKDSDEVTNYGLIDSTSVFVRDEEDDNEWTNGTDSYPVGIFEEYLRKC